MTQASAPDIDDTADVPYGTDLAFVHETGFADVARAAARELLARVPAPARVADLGCGGGTLAEALVRRGCTVWGVDTSPAMVALARRRVPRASFDVADALAVRLPACDAITLVGEILNYALAERSLVAADGFFTRAYAALRPGGVLLLDVATTGKAPSDYVADRSGKGWRVQAHVRAEGDRLERTIDTWRTQDGVEGHTREVHHQRLLRSDWMEERLEAAGFSVEAIGGYDDFPFEEGWDAFAATRPT